MTELSMVLQHPTSVTWDWTENRLYMVYKLPGVAADDHRYSESGKLSTAAGAEGEWTRGEKHQHSSKPLIWGASFSENIAKRLNRQRADQELLEQFQVQWVERDWRMKNCYLTHSSIMQHLE